jgi:hypothetical protein
MIRSSYLIIVFCCLAECLLSQVRDAGMWTDISLNLDLGKNLGASISPEVRLDENISRVARAFTDVGLQYKLGKYFSTGVTYRGGVSNSNYGFNGRHRMQYTLLCRYKLGDFAFTLQSRWQVAVTSFSAENDADFITTLRNKFQLKYTGLKGIDLSSSFETFNNTGRYSDFQLQNWRWIANVEKKINKRNSISLGYLIQKSLLDSPQQLDYVFLISYQYNLNLKKKKTDKDKELKPETR